MKRVEVEMSTCGSWTFSKLLKSVRMEFPRYFPTLNLSFVDE